MRWGSTSRGLAKHFGRIAKGTKNVGCLAKGVKNFGRIAKGGIFRLDHFLKVCKNNFHVLLGYFRQF